MIRESTTAMLTLPPEIDAGVTVPSGSFGWRRGPGAVLPMVLLVSLATFAVVCYLHFGRHVRAYQLMDDPVSYAKLEWYTGVLSQVVVLLWCASAAVCGFAGVLMRGGGDTRLNRLSRFLVVLAVSSLWLTLDDLLLLHEQVARHLVGREYQHHGEGVLFALYAVVMASCFWRFRTTIARTEYILLIGAVLSLLASASIDVGFQLELDGNNLFRETVLSVPWGAPVIDIAEELLKLNGAMLWFVYFLRTGYSGVKDVMPDPAKDSARLSST
jgi:hypothetical protein